MFDNQLGNIEINLYVLDKFKFYSHLFLIYIFYCLVMKFESTSYGYSVCL